MAESTASITALLELVALLGLFYSVARRYMTSDDAEQMEMLSLKMLRSGNKGVRDAAQQSFTLYLDTLGEEKKEAVFHQFEKVLSGRGKLEAVEEEQAVRAGKRCDV